MTRHVFLFTLIIHSIFLIYCVGQTSSTNRSRLLIISFDGFRHQYLNTYSLPTINRIRYSGIRAKNGMQPTFVTNTFPNHISIATGMYEENHGIIHNRFYDTNLQQFITFGTRDVGQWNDSRVEPIWITATKQNIQSAVLYWPAAHNEFNGTRPLFYSSVYSDSIPLREKIDNAMSYFTETPVQLVMLYHFEPDKSGHFYGPDAPEMNNTLFDVDNDVDYLLTKVKEELKDDLNIIILSDHGMTNTKRLVQPFYQGYIDKLAVDNNSIIDGAIFSVTPLSQYFEQVRTNLSQIPNVTVYKREDFPPKYHYANVTTRIGTIIVLPNNEDIFFSQATTATNASKGNHGYDNTLPTMQAIFMARGPDFNQNMEIDSLKNGDVYHIACRILGLKPNPYATAGSLNNLTGIFRTRVNACSRLSIHASVVFYLLVSYFIIKF